VKGPRISPEPHVAHSTSLGSMRAGFIHASHVLASPMRPRNTFTPHHDMIDRPKRMHMAYNGRAIHTPPTP
jgi:hypothetical protein